MQCPLTHSLYKDEQTDIQVLFMGHSILSHRYSQESPRVSRPKSLPFSSAMPVGSGGGAVPAFVY
jgi:hypothetical protein